MALLLCLGSNAYAVDYRAINPGQLDSMVDGKKNIRLLYFFTSWCSVCKKNYQQLLRLEEKYKNDDIRIIAVSLDEDLGTLRHFMSRHTGDKSTIYHLLYADPNDVGHVFAKYGIRYRGAIPHVTLLDESGKIIADGSYDLSYFDKGLDQLLKKS